MNYAQLKTEVADQNLLLMNAGDVMVLIEYDDSKPVNKLVIANLKTGTQYVARPEAVAAVVGYVTTENLRWPGNKPVTQAGDDMRFRMHSGGGMTQIHNVTVGGKSVALEVGDTIHMGSGKVGIFTGMNPRAPKNPVNFEVNGKGWRGRVASIIKVVPRVKPAAAGKKVGA